MMQKILAALLSVLLLSTTFALSAGAEHTLYYHDNYYFETADDLANVASENVTVNTTDKVAEMAASAHLYKGFEIGIDTVEVELSVKRGSSTVRFSNGTVSNCFQVKVTPTDYTIYAENPAAGSYDRTVASGTHDGDVTVAYFVDAANDQVTFTVNGVETVLPVAVGNFKMTETTIANSVTNFNCVGIFADAIAGDGPHTTVTAVRIGPLVLPPSQSSSKPIEVMLHKTVNDATVYSIELVFGNFDFTYTPARYENYDPVTHQYLNVTPAAWEGNDGVNNVIYVTNRSNAAVQVDVVHNMNKNLHGVTFDMDGELSKTLASALDRKEPDTLVVTATVGGEPDEDHYVTDGKTLNRIGTIIVGVYPA